jgi:GH18 family chitinase
VAPIPYYNAFPSIKSVVGFLFVLVSLFYSLNLVKDLQEPLPNSMTRKKAILYHTNWANYARNFQVKDIPIEGITDIAYAFFNLKDSGNGNWVITSGDTYSPPIPP